VAFHDQPDQAFALFVALGEELLGRGPDRFVVGLDLDLGDRFDRHRHALPGVEILLGSHVEGHELEGKIAAVLDHGEHDRAATGDHALAAKAINNQRFMRARLAVEPGQHAHHEQDCQHRQSRYDPDFHWYAEHIASSKTSRQASVVRLSTGSSTTDD
jgi:hypothetical protein